MKLSDFEPIDKGKPIMSIKYPDEPYMNVRTYTRAKYQVHVYLCGVAVRKLDVRHGDGIRFMKNGDRFFVYRTEGGAPGSYLASFSDRRRQEISISCAALGTKGCPDGEYMLWDAIHVEGVDLFEMVPVAEYFERRADEP